MVGGFTPSRCQFLGHDTEQPAEPLDYYSPADAYYGIEASGMDSWLSNIHTFNNSVFKDTLTNPAFPDSKKENPVSVKGTAITTDLNTAGEQFRNFCMSDSFTTKHPIIIDEIAISINVNPNFDKTFSTTGESGFPPWWGNLNEAGSSLGDLQFVLSVEHDMISEDIQLRTNEFMKQQFHDWLGHLFQSPTVEATTASFILPDLGMPDMIGPAPTSHSAYLNTACLFFVFDNLKISVPEYGKWKLHILIPDYQKASHFAGQDWGTRPEYFEITWSVTGLEELNNGEY